MTKENFDHYNLRKVIIDYPNQLKKGQEFTKNIHLENKKYSNLIICGMGGSALPGELLISLMNNVNDENKLPIYINRTYSLPKIANKDSLIFISSYSGNTEETVSCFHEAIQKKYKVIAFSESGKVESIAKENNIPHVKYKIDYEGFQPRYACTYAMIAMHEILTKINLSDKIRNLPKIESTKYEALGKELAKKCKGKTPIIYSSENFKIISKIWKIKINENSKTPAFWNYFPELNHNEMVGFTNPQAKFFSIMLKDQKDHPQTKRRIDITSKLYEQKGIEVEKIEIEGSSYLEKILNCMLISDWHSYYLAKEYNQDPTPVEMVEDLKLHLK